MDAPKTRAVRATGWSWTSTSATAAARARSPAPSRTTCRPRPSVRPSATASPGCASTGSRPRARPDRAFVPMMCQQCGDKTPCASRLPAERGGGGPASGIVAQVPVRCLGCRYCMAACPYHARSFNWWDPDWPGRLPETLNPEVSTRTRGVVEKCTFCSTASRPRRTRRPRRVARRGRPPTRRRASRPARRGAIVFGNLDAPAGRGGPPHDGARHLPPPRAAGDRSEGLLPHRARLGAAPRRRRAATSDGRTHG